MMKVKLIGYTDIMAMTPELAAAICIGREDKHPALSNQKPTEETIETLGKGAAHAIKSGHLGILEHISMSWYVEGISRACSHQLVRHRIASYNQQSQRYCKIDTGDDWYVVPESVGDNTAAKQLYYKAMNGIATIYKELLEGGIPKEDARMVLPNACTTNILITMNGRSFVEAAEKRLCNRAQWEIRELFSRMRNTLISVYPFVAALAAPRCLKRGCVELKPCGHPPKGGEMATGATFKE